MNIDPQDLIDPLCQALDALGERVVLINYAGHSDSVSCVALSGNDTHIESAPITRSATGAGAIQRSAYEVARDLVQALREAGSLHESGDEVRASFSGSIALHVPSRCVLI